MTGANSSDRGRVWKLLGAPTDQVGSVNDPRTHEEHGVKWNEKWVYRGEDGRSVERIVLWNRYLQSFEFRDRRVSLNRKQIQYEDDGSFKPGFPMWILLSR